MCVCVGVRVLWFVLFCFCHNAQCTHARTLLHGMGKGAVYCRPTHSHTNNLCALCGFARGGLNLHWPTSTGCVWELFGGSENPSRPVCLFPFCALWHNCACCMCVCVCCRTKVWQPMDGSGLAENPTDGANFHRCCFVRFSSSSSRLLALFAPAAMLCHYTQLPKADRARKIAHFVVWDHTPTISQEWLSPTENVMTKWLTHELGPTKSVTKYVIGPPTVWVSPLIMTVVYVTRQKSHDYACTGIKLSLAVRGIALDSSTRTSCSACQAVKS